MTGNWDAGGRAGAGRDDDRDADPWQRLRRGPIADRVYGHLERRRARIQRDIAKGQRSRIPTWVLAATLAAIVVGWVLLVVLL